MVQTLAEGGAFRGIRVTPLNTKKADIFKESYTERNTKSVIAYLSIKKTNCHLLTFFKAV